MFGSPGSGADASVPPIASKIRRRVATGGPMPQHDQYHLLCMATRVHKTCCRNACIDECEEHERKNLVEQSCQREARESPLSGYHKLQTNEQPATASECPCALPISFAYDIPTSEIHWFFRLNVSKQYLSGINSESERERERGGESRTALRTHIMKSPSNALSLNKTQLEGANILLVYTQAYI